MWKQPLLNVELGVAMKGEAKFVSFVLAAWFCSRGGDLRLVPTGFGVSGRLDGLDLTGLVLLACWKSI